MKTWSKTIESGWIDFLGLSKELAKKNRGRGDVKVIKKTQEKRKEKKNTNYKELTKMAITDLKNARRCE